MSMKAFQEKVQFTSEHVQKFCVEVGQTYPWYVSAHEKPHLPLDFFYRGVLEGYDSFHYARRTHWVC